MPTENSGPEISSERYREKQRQENLRRGRYEGPIMGCVCPPTSEQTCQNPLCPRKNPIKQ